MSESLEITTNYNIVYLNVSVTRKQILLIIKNSQKKSRGQYSFTEEFYNIFIEKVTPFLYKMAIIFKFTYRLSVTLSKF